MSGIIADLSFCDYLPFKAESYFIVSIYHMLFIDLSFRGHLGCFYALAIMNNAAVSNNGYTSNLSFFFLPLYTAAPSGS